MKPRSVIGFDVSQTGRFKAGCGYMADSLMRQLARADRDNEYILYPTFGPAVWDEHWPRTTLHLHQRNIRRAAGQHKLSDLETFWRQADVDLDAALGNPDVVHSNNFFCPTTLRRARLVYTLHDLAFVDHPEWTTEDNRVTCFTGVLAASVHADHIVAVSHATRDHFLRVFPHYPTRRISVVYSASRFADRSVLGRSPAALRTMPTAGFWLSVGTLEPRKNYTRLLHAYARYVAQAASGGVPLVIAGGKGWLVDDLEQQIDDLSLRGRVLLLGYVDDAELVWLYEHCFAFVYVSTFEGFGLPVVEAMSFGAPVVAGNTTSLPELVGAAGIMVDPFDEEQISAAMRRVATDSVCRAALRSASFERAKQFSWSDTAKQVLNVYHTVLDQPAFGAIATAREPQELLAGAPILGHTP
ncbi:MAG: glycosyltransferase family 4 protein [Chloroflexota bacterium]|nr:glycosyltransferase family 4 protein [Chloroflexota bacterium]